MNDSTPRTIEIPLTKGYVAIVDEQDADLAQFKWTATGKEPHVYGYRHIKNHGKIREIRMHVVILERILDRRLDKGEYPDHENHIGTDNRRSNLRLATKITNAQNAVIRSDNKSGFKGVYKVRHCNAYAAEIRVNKKKIPLGSFRSAKIAACAYNAAAVKYFGEFALLNDIPNWQELIAQHNPALSMRNTSGYKGVSYKDGRWRAYVRVDGKAKHIGQYATPEDANEARLKYLAENGL